MRRLPKKNLVKIKIRKLQLQLYDIEGTRRKKLILENQENVKAEINNKDENTEKFQSHNRKCKRGVNIYEE